MKSSVPTKTSGEKLLERVRRICISFPETFEKISHGEPTFFVKKKVFAMCSNNHHNDGHIAVVVPAAIGVQAALIESSPETFYRPPYVGGSGWVGIEIAQVSDRELELHLKEAWNLIAPEKLKASLQRTSPRQGTSSATQISLEPKARKSGQKK